MSQSGLSACSPAPPTIASISFSASGAENFRLRTISAISETRSGSMPQSMEFSRPLKGVA
jgi:hypothetical protein